MNAKNLLQMQGYTLSDFSRRALYSWPLLMITEPLIESLIESLIDSLVEFIKKAKKVTEKTNIEQKYCTNLLPKKNK